MLEEEDQIPSLKHDWIRGEFIKLEDIKPLKELVINEKMMARVPSLYLCDSPLPGGIQGV